jgi:hypothetical protein
LRSRIDLFLLRNAINQLAETTYFSTRLHEFTAKILDAISYVIENEATIAPTVVQNFRSTIHRTHMYLAGSTTKEAPYEMEYCLKKALSIWVSRDTIITTALTDGHDFHFSPADPWKFIKTFVPGFATNGYDPLLVQLGLPRLYRHKPIYCLALYHELGHFVDEYHGITKLSMLLDPSPLAIGHLQIPTTASTADKERVELSHRKEYFCDMFGAAYVGSSSIETLVAIAPNAPASNSHPATSDRQRSVGAFISGRADPLALLYQKCLTQQKIPNLTKFFVPPSIGKYFDDIRPYQIMDSSELHGTLSAAWSYLATCLDKREAPWIEHSTTDEEIERVVNDLTEKTLRNASIRERWSNGAAA